MKSFNETSNRNSDARVTSLSHVYDKKRYVMSSMQIRCTCCRCHVTTKISCMFTVTNSEVSTDIPVGIVRRVGFDFTISPTYYVKYLLGFT